MHTQCITLDYAELSNEDFFVREELLNSLEI